MCLCRMNPTQYFELCNQSFQFVQNVFAESKHNDFLRQGRDILDADACFALLNQRELRYRKMAKDISQCECLPTLLVILSLLLPCSIHHLETLDSAELFVSYFRFEFRRSVCEIRGSHS